MMEKILIPNNIQSLFDRLLLNGNCGDLQQKCDSLERDAIFTETFSRCFKKYWTSEDNSIFKKITEKDRKTVQVTLQKSAKQTSEIDFSCMLKFKYDFHEETLSIDIVNISASSPEVESQYLNKLEEEMNEAKEKMLNTLKPIDFIQIFFDILHREAYTLATGTEASIMYKIYYNARSAYPLFRKLNYIEGVELMKKCYARGRASKFENKDIYCYACATFKVFNEIEMDKIIRRYDAIISSTRNFYKKGERRTYGSRRKGERYENNALIFSTYEVNGKSGSYQTSFLAYDLWMLLTSGAYCELEGIGA